MIPALLWAGFGAILRVWWLVLGASLLALAILYGYSLYVVVLRARARFGSGTSRIDVIVVTSDSPHWRDVIRSEWLPHMPRHTAVLNWSERKHWRRNLATRLIRAHVDDRYRPVVMIMKGLQHPLIFEFWRAFRDHKHGKPLALETMQRRMFDELRQLEK